MSGHQIKNHTIPVYSAIAHLPKDELAATADALVSLNAFQKKVSMELETVAGPIDVAVITKGDGLIWMQRKHYFPADRNFHFFQNYYRLPKPEEIITGGSGGNEKRNQRTAGKRTGKRTSKNRE